jgi:UDP-2,3-diacylglucosamine hydrolase
MAGLPRRTEVQQRQKPRRRPDFAPTPRFRTPHSALRTPHFGKGIFSLVYNPPVLSLNWTVVQRNLPAIGIIAGNRTLPLVFARQARALGVSRIVAVAFEGETDPALAPLVDEIVWLKVGQLSKLISAFTSRGIQQCVMAGQIAPKNLYDVRPDLRAMGMLLRLKQKNAHTVFGAIADELKKDGVELIAATPWLEPLMPARGFHLGPAVNAEVRADLEFGFRIAKEITRLEIGQTVVVKDGTVLAVEAFEGTDECLARGGQLAGKKGGAVAVKVARLNHDMRFDIPCIGPQTFETCATAGIAALALESGQTLLLEPEACARLAGKNKISVTTIA